MKIQLIVNGKPIPDELLWKLFNPNFDMRAWESKEFKELEKLMQTARARKDYIIIESPTGQKWIFETSKRSC